jgi:AmiR/NasT family two-component response regulator
MDQPRFRTHLSASNGDPTTRQAARAVVHDAIRLIRSEHDVREVAAFAMLVDASVEAGCTVRETASRLMQATTGSTDRTP